MIAARFIPLIVKQVVRHPARSALTIGGVATAMFLYVAVQAMHRGVEEATTLTAKDNTLVVYREDRFCPFTSRLPEYYLPKIAQLDGVRSVTPMKVVVNNCRANLDVVTFRGVPKDTFTDTHAKHLIVLDGSFDGWRKRSDAALVGKVLADRRGLKVGDRFNAAGIFAYVAGIVDSPEPQDQNVAYVSLAFLQQASDRKLGTVTQFNVRVDDPNDLERVAGRIDALFDHAEQPTTTRSEKAFVAQAAADMIELVGFTRYLGVGCLVAVLALVGNAIVLSVQSRVKEHAILQTLGFTGALLGRLIVAEGVVLGMAGGLLGTAGALAVIEWGQFSMAVDGVSIPIRSQPVLIVTGLAVSMVLGVLAGVVPAWQASRRSIAECFRAV